MRKMKVAYVMRNVFRVLVAAKLRIENRLQTALNKSRIVNYQGFFIELPANHLLPVYKANHREYDKFLPILAKYISGDKSIIDIGANVGDSLAGMVEENSTSSYLCIEADEDFFKLLKKNVSRMENFHKNTKILVIKELIGSAVSNVNLSGINGTKHATESYNNEGMVSVTLDAVLKKNGSFNVGLLKSDVDGFDYDVLDSSMETILRDFPVLYFELYFENSMQENGYRKTLSNLEKSGYRYWTVFDNYGGVILNSVDVNIVFQLMSYTARQNFGLSSRTFYYFDILAVKEENLEIVDMALSDFLKD